jgi:hypothetical protein
MNEKRTVWVAYTNTNTDCTEGRGHDVPIAVCAVEATALRMARKKYVQGSDGPVRTMELVKIDGKWYAPSAALTVVEPTREDTAAQAAIDAKREAVAKAKAAGLTDADLLALGLRAQRLSSPAGDRRRSRLANVRWSKGLGLMGE